MYFPKATLASVLQFRGSSFIKTAMEKCCCFMMKGTAILPLLILIDLNTKTYEKNNSVYATLFSKLFIHKKPKAMKTKINLLPLLWVFLIPLTTALCQNKASPPKDNAKTKYSCCQENIDKENKNFLGDFSNIIGWIEKTPDDYLSTVSQS